MKKTVSVNIKGFNFLIEEDAYEMLSNYINKLKNSLGNQEGAKEITEDIEIRIAELFNTLLHDKKQVIEIEEVTMILEKLGDPSQFVDNEESESTNDESKHETNKDEKRIYRDKQNGVIGGVCRGISNYLNIDVVIIRAIFVVVFLIAGFGIPLYIILWIIIPQAKSSIDRLKMRGKPITVENVKSEVEEAGERISTASKKFAKEFKQDLKYDKIRTIGRLITSAIGLFLIFIGVSSLISFLIFIIGGFEMIPAQTENGFLSLTAFAKIILSNPSDIQQMWIAIYLISGAWILFFLLTGFSLLFRIRNNWTKYSIISIIIAGTVGVFMSIILSIRTGKDFAIEGEVEIQTIDYNGDVLNFGQSDLKYTQSGMKIKSDGQFGMLSIENDELINNGIHFEFIPSKDSVYHVHQWVSAHSFSHKNAIKKASHIKNEVYLNEQTVWVSPEYRFPLKDKMRDQEVYIIVEIPTNKSVIFDNQIINFNPNQTQEEWTEITKKKGLMYQNGRFKLSDNY